MMPPLEPFCYANFVKKCVFCAALNRKKTAALKTPLLLVLVHFLCSEKRSFYGPLYILVCTFRHVDSANLTEYWYNSVTL